MKLTKALALGLALTAAAGAAHAQTPACTTLNGLLAMPHAKVKALQGAKTEEDKESITYVSKTQMPGMTNCTIESDLAKDKFTDYWQHHLHCRAEAANSEAATQAIESLWSCTKDTFSERAPSEAWMGGKYRTIGFDGEVQTGGRSAGLVSFGDVDYARVDIEKSFDTSKEYSLHLYWLFTE
jgi:hypothetical protein